MYPTTYMYVCMYVWSSHIAEYGSTGYGCQSCSWSAEQGKWIFPCPRACLRIWSRETGSAVPPRVSLFILHTQAQYGAYLRDPSRVPRRRSLSYYLVYKKRHTPSGQSRVYRVTQLRTDGVHCRESYCSGNTTSTSFHSSRTAAYITLTAGSSM